MSGSATPSQAMAAAVLAGRALLAAIFLYEASAKLGGYAAATTYMASFGVPTALLPAVIAVEFIGGAFVLIGLWTRAAAIALAGFCVAAAVLFHADFARRNEVLHFEKDLAIAGGFLVLFAHGGGAWAVDALLVRRQRRLDAQLMPTARRTESAKS